MPADDLTHSRLLELSGISLHIGSVQVLQDIAVAVAPGAPTVMMGPNGAGKTSLLKVMAGLLKPTTGRINSPPKRTSFVFQKPTMLRRSVADNVAFAMTHAGLSAQPRAVERALDQVGLLALASRSARRLSGGEQQRLAIARALARNPEILFLDEPTASLDPQQTKTMEDIIAEAARCGVKVVMSTHDIGEAKRLSGDVMFMAGGRLIEHTAANVFFNRPATLAARRFLAGELVI